MNTNTYLHIIIYSHRLGIIIITITMTIIRNMLYDLFEFRQRCKYSALLFAWYPVDHPGPVRIVVRVCLFIHFANVSSAYLKKNQSS